MHVIYTNETTISEVHELCVLKHCSVIISLKINLNSQNLTQLLEEKKKNNKENAHANDFCFG